MRRLLDRIPPHLPRAWVTGILLWVAGAAGMAVAVACGMLGWKPGFAAASAFIAFCVFGFMACVVWFLFEKLAGRVTPWRRIAATGLPEA